METVEGNKITTETLGGNSSSTQPTDLGSERSGGAAVVVTRTVVDETEVTVVKKINQDKEETDGGGVVKNQEKKCLGCGEEKWVSDEDMKVEYCRNGISVVLDVKSCLGDENGSEVKPVFEGYTGSVADEHVHYAVGDPMDGCLSGQKEKNGNGAEIFESEENAGEKSREVGESDSKSGFQEIWEDASSELAEIEVKYDGKEDEIEDHDFMVGDFVWGKIKSHPWWPGQIYDPADASDYAATLKHKGGVLVAYFGDGSFSWCSPSQLKPFVACFQEMSDQSDSKKFVNAVQKALDEVGRLVEVELMYKCQTVDRIENAMAANSGIKAGCHVPKGNTIKVLIDRMEPVHLLSTLKASATTEPRTRMLELELTLLKSCLSAYRRKGGYLLPVYHEPKCIEGLEEKMRGGNVATGDINGPSESLDNGDDRLYQGRKQKSVAELLAEGTSIEDEPKVKKAKTSKDGASGTKSSSGMKRERKRKVVVVSESPESDHESGGVEEETLSPRQRKKSKYLSPPYTSPIWSGKASGSFKEPKSEPETAAKQLEDSSSKRSSGEKSHQRRRPRDPEEEHKKIADGAVDVNQVLHGLTLAALDPWCLTEQKSLETVMSEFISSFRSSIFEEGSNNQIEQPDSGVTLIIELPPAVSLPTKAELLKTYRKFGGLIKKETRIVSRAFVGFANSWEAEAALDMSLEKKPFGGVEYRLCDNDDGRKDLVLMKEKLEMMSEMVSKCKEGEMSGDMKASLEGGMKELLDKISKMEK